MGSQFVGGYEAGKNRQAMQEEMAMKKEQFKQQSAMNQQAMSMNEQTMTMQDQQIQALKDTNTAFKKSMQNMDRVNIQQGIADYGDNPTENLKRINATNLAKGLLKPGTDKETKDLLYKKGYNRVNYYFDKESGDPTTVDEKGLWALHKKAVNGDIEAISLIEQIDTNANKDEQDAINNYKPYVISGKDGSVIDIEDIAMLTGNRLSEKDAKALYKKAGMYVAPVAGDNISGGTKMQSSFGKFYADMSALGVDSTKVSKMYMDMEKNPKYSQAIQNMIAAGETDFSTSNIDKYVKSIKGTTPAATSGGDKDAISAYDKMINMAKEYKVDFNKPEAMKQYNALPEIDKNRIKAAAKEYITKSGEELVKPAILGKHIDTLRMLGNDGEKARAALQDASGMGDVVANSFIKYFNSNDGIEFQKDFNLLFNNLLTAGSPGGHINKAEVDNLERAIGGLAASNDAVFKNFKSMVRSMNSQLEGTTRTAPIVGKILYGKELNAYKVLMEVLDSVDPDTKVTGKTITTKDGITQPALDFGEVE